LQRVGVDFVTDHNCAHTWMLGDFHSWLKPYITVVRSNCPEQAYRGCSECSQETCFSSHQFCF
jgi:hypothetical protein